MHLSKFADDTKLSGTADKPEGWDAIKRHPDKPKNWAHEILWGLKRPNGGKPHYQYKPGDEQIESSSLEKDLEVLVGEKLDKSWLPLQPRKTIMSCIQSSMAREMKEVVLPLCSTLRPHLNAMSSTGSPADKEPVGASPEWGHQDG